MICNTKISIPHIEKFDRSSPRNPLKPLQTKGLQENHNFCRFFKIYTFSRGIRCTSFIKMRKFLFFTGLMPQNFTARFESMKKRGALLIWGKEGRGVLRDELVESTSILSLLMKESYNDERQESI